MCWCDVQARLYWTYFRTAHAVFNTSFTTVMAFIATGIETVDLRDIRSVVVAADGAARDEETRALADQLREGLSNRVDAEHNAWRDELDEHHFDWCVLVRVEHSDQRLA